MGTIISQPNNEINITFAEGISTDSDTIIKLINVNVADTTYDTSIEVTYNSEVINLIIEEECKYTPIDIYFMNKEGAQECLTFFKKRIEKMDVSKSTFESNIGIAINSYHQFNDYNIQARSSFKVNSGFVSENLNDDFKQLVLSSKVYYHDGTNFIPLNIITRSLTYLTKANDKLINYEIEFAYSYNEILNQ